MKEDRLQSAVAYLRCPRCSGCFQVLSESEVKCGACGSIVKIEGGNIFHFEESELSENVMENTLYGPESEELLRELADEGSARLGFSKYLSRQSENLCAFDYGCGSSRQVFDLAKYFRSGIVFALDYDLAPLRIISDAAKKLGIQNIFLLQFRSAKLPFQDDIFEVVTAHQVLEHVSDPEESMSEIRRIMKKKGVADVDFPNGNSLGEIARRFFHKITKTKNPHISRISLKRARKMFEKNGFGIEESRSVQIFTGPLSYFFEGLILRYILKKRKIWETRKRYQNSFLFRAFGKFERNLGKYFPRGGHAFEFKIRKT